MKAWLGRLALLALVGTLVPACGGGGTLSSGDGSLSRLVLSMLGGRGTVGDGGDGGYFEAYQYSPSDLKILRTGTVETAFSVPSVAPFLGSNPRTLTGTVTLTPTAGATSDTILGDDGVNPATGLWVRSGAVVTIAANYDSNNADGDGLPATGTKEIIYLDVAEGVLIEGTLIGGHVDVVEGDGASDNAASFNVTCNTFVLRSSGRIVNAGTDRTAGTDGGNGGSFTLDAFGGVILSGQLDASGGTGDNGGDGGDVDLESTDYNFWFTGRVDTSGGPALDAAGVGGDAGDMDMYGSGSGEDLGGGGFFGSGVIVAVGGNGPAGGGDGSDIYLSGYYLGSTVFAGSADFSGGNATTLGDGGDAGEIGLDAYGGGVRVRGTLTGNGGAGAGAGSFGGDGGYVYAESYEDDDYDYNDYNTGRGIYFGARVNLNGGAGENGGDGGNVYFECNEDGYGAVGSNPLFLVGYANVLVRGGDGAVNGGDGGGSNYIDNYGDDTYEGVFFVGSVENQAAFDGRGGNGGTGDGGDADYFEIYGEYGSDNVLQSAVNSGTLDFRGGNGGGSGGEGGDVWMYDWRRMANHGTVYASGGNGNASNGGDAGYIELFGDGDVESTASLFGTGGHSAQDDGGWGDYIYVYAGARLLVSGAIRGSGGNGSAGPGGEGGDGADIHVNGGDIGTTFSFKSATSSGGTGETAGVGGEIWLFGIRIQ